ncbi:hypothetical protein F5887DRAFT_923033 [Amanita rubescens]|nr:hypothetical protein F5887DRAFT_923033 [Amanita rubescens]
MGIDNFDGREKVKSVEKERKSKLWVSLARTPTSTVPSFPLDEKRKEGEMKYVNPETSSGSQWNNPTSCLTSWLPARLDVRSSPENNEGCLRFWERQPASQRNRRKKGLNRIIFPTPLTIPILLIDACRPLDLTFAQGNLRISAASTEETRMSNWKQREEMVFLFMGYMGVVRLQLAFIRLVGKRAGKWCRSPGLDELLILKERKRSVPRGNGPREDERCTPWLVVHGKSGMAVTGSRTFGNSNEEEKNDIFLLPTFLSCHLALILACRPPHLTFAHKLEALAMTTGRHNSRKMEG